VNSDRGFAIRNLRLMSARLFKPALLTRLFRISSGVETQKELTVFGTAKAVP
jgi:hypothetical protein